MNFHLKAKLWKGYIKSREILLPKLHTLLNISHTLKLKFDKNWKLAGISAYLEIPSNKMDKICAKNKMNFSHLFKYLNCTEWENAIRYFQMWQIVSDVSLYVSVSPDLFSLSSV